VAYSRETDGTARPRNGAGESSSQPDSGYIARVTTVFHHADGDVELIAGQPVHGLSAKQLELLAALDLIERV